jgi:hypothetical protein
MASRRRKGGEELTNEDIQYQLHQAIIEFTEGELRSNQKYSPSLTVAPFTECGKTMTHITVPLQGVDRLNVTDLVHMVDAFPVLGTEVELQKENGYNTLLIHAPWVVEEQPDERSVIRRPGGSGRRFTSAGPRTNGFQLWRLLLWISFSMFLLTFASVKHQYLGW